MIRYCLIILNVILLVYFFCNLFLNKKNNKKTFSEKMYKIKQQIKTGERFTLKNGNHRFGLNKKKGKKVDMKSLDRILDLNIEEKYIEVESFTRLLIF